MRNLVAKDFRLVAPYAWAIVPVHVLWCAQAFLAPELYFWTNLAGALSWTAGVLAVEWHMDSDRLVASLPVARSTIVRARYVSALGGLALGAILFVVYGHAIAVIAPDRLLARWGSSPTWGSIEGIAAFALTGFVILVVFLPFHFRFGLPFGASWFAVSVTLVLLLAAACARVLGHPHWVSGRPPSAVLGESLSALVRSWGVPLASATLAAGAAALGAFSMWLSGRFNEAREL